MKTATSTRLPTQVFVSHTKPEPDKIEPVQIEHFWKPRKGGMWTSSLDDEGGQWLRWLLGEGYSLEQERWGGKLWALEPLDANVYVIDNPGDLLALSKRYPHPDAEDFALKGLETMAALVDWRKVAENYDAVWTPNPWPWRFGHSDMALSMFFYSLDAESTIWFRWCFEEEPRELDPGDFLRPDA